MELSIIEEKMIERIEYLKSELSNIRVGRANPQILNKIMVDYYGTRTPLNQVASISVPESRQLLISPWDKEVLPLISKEIHQADLGLNPINDGNGIRLMFPELNETRRKEIAKDAKELGEDVKVSIRNIRRDFLQDIKREEKDGNISEDDMYGSEDKVQKLTDKYIELVANEIIKKEKEIMEI